MTAATSLDHLVTPTRVGSSQPPILNVDQVVKRYGGLTVLDGVSFSIHRGEVMCLIGPSGSGKSTVLRCCNALEKLDSGRIVFEGVDLADRRANVFRASGMGMVFQDPSCFPTSPSFATSASGQSPSCA